MKLQSQISLKAYNTFGIDVKAAEFVQVDNIEEVKVLCQAFNLAERRLLILGGGSNVLLTKDFDGMVILNRIRGIEVVAEDDQFVWVKAMAGEVWHDFVKWCIERNLGGVENLSLIPGCVGAAPMQNIGAYGVELKNVFDSLEAISIVDGEVAKFTRERCQFGYRESIFKHEEKGKHVIVSVTFKLLKTPRFNTTYGAIQLVLDKYNVKELSVKAISDAVIEIRTSKLPDPKVLGNAGSFFKNPEIPEPQYQKLKELHPGLVAYPAGEGMIKIAAGWLIDQCGWKGKRVGNTGSHKDQALVLVNYGGANGKEILQLALDIQKSVKEKFGILINPEVNIF